MRAPAGGGNAPADGDAGRGASFETVDDRAGGGEADDAGAGMGAVMPLRPDVEAVDGAEAVRGANGAAGPPIGRAAMGGVERAPALPELTKGATLEERGDVLAAPEPPAPVELIGGRMKGGATGRAPAPPVTPGATVDTGAATRPACAEAGATGAAAVAGIVEVAGFVAETTGAAADVRSLATGPVATGANAPAGVDAARS